MKDSNHVHFIGRLVKDAELKNFDGYSRLDFCVAFNTSKKDGDKWVDESNFINLSISGNKANSLSSYLVKGTQVSIEGHLKQSRWEKDGQKHSRIDVAVEEIQLLGSSKKSDGPAGPAATVNALQNAGLVSEDSNSFPEDMFF